MECSASQCKASLESGRGPALATAAPARDQASSLPAARELAAASRPCGRGPRGPAAARKPPSLNQRPNALPRFLRLPGPLALTITAILTMALLFLTAGAGWEAAGAGAGLGAGAAAGGAAVG